MDDLGKLASELEAHRGFRRAHSKLRDSWSASQGWHRKRIASALRKSVPLRVQVAWAALRGHSVAYRVTLTHSLTLQTNHAIVAEVLFQAEEHSCGDC